MLALSGTKNKYRFTRERKKRHPGSQGYCKNKEVTTVTEPHNILATTNVCRTSQHEDKDQIENICSRSSMARLNKDRKPQQNKCSLIEVSEDTAM